MLKAVWQGQGGHSLYSAFHHSHGHSSQGLPPHTMVGPPGEVWTLSAPQIVPTGPSARAQPPEPIPHCGPNPHL
jgi:hypothetical protein